MTDSGWELCWPRAPPRSPPQPPALPAPPSPPAPTGPPTRPPFAPTFLEVLGHGYCRDDNGQQSWQGETNCQDSLSDCREHCFAFGGCDHLVSGNTCAPNGLGRCIVYLGSARATHKQADSRSIHGVRSAQGRRVATAGTSASVPPEIPPQPGMCENTCLYPEDGVCDDGGPGEAQHIQIVCTATTA
eukprot:3383473-Prymnesium_polylepis.3